MGKKLKAKAFLTFQKFEKCPPELKTSTFSKIYGFKYP
jgi:hypothetical protein